MKKSWHALELASEELRADKVVVLEAVRQDILALKYASLALADKEGDLCSSIHSYVGSLFDAYTVPT